ncbi:nucleoside phosphorylase [Thermococcus litoralis]|uniref:nucleoside phosphorylase n=1 Tax=Thermococcus litoralis TaxID=2265 RepID=UPI000B35F43B|nr:nucleoside phosphorylase [Thermococcus litoralis]
MWLGKGHGIVKPNDFVKHKEPCEKYLITFTDIAREHAKRLLKDIEVREKCTYAYEAFIGEYKGEKIYVLNPYFGASPSVFALEIAIAKGARKFIVVGEAGAIKPEVKIGDVILPTWALREEGTSYHYMPPEYVPKPNQKLFGALEEEIKGQIKGVVNIFKGGIWTTDAAFRETDDKVKEYSERGILGVEMETSALMSVAEFRGVNLAVALAVSDELYHDIWNHGFKSEKLKRTEKLLVNAALEVLVSL